MAFNMKLAIPAILATMIICSVATTANADAPDSFWDEPQYGGNSFNVVPPNKEYFDALAKTGVTWVRLTFSKWPGVGQDFLIGNADAYNGIPADDLETLKDELDLAHEAGLKVVITPLSLPGARWSQQNDGNFDDRLWSDIAYWDQAAHFWSDLASALKDHPAVIAYNIINEPVPERSQNLIENGTLDQNRAFVVRHTGTARDLPGFYNHVIKAIRGVDSLTSIMVDGGYFANPRSLAAWPVLLEDDNILYAFHMYEPYVATSVPNRNREVPFRYPGIETDYAGGRTTWDRTAVQAHIDTAFDWAETQGLLPARIVAAEFGCIRTWEDCGTYLSDVMRAVNDKGGHWAFYAFREDEWEGMDYEIPASFPQGRFYWFTEENRTSDIPRDGPLIDLIKAQIEK